MSVGYLRICWLSLNNPLHITLGSTDMFEYPRHLALRGHQIHLFCPGYSNNTHAYRETSNFCIHEFKPFMNRILKKVVSGNLSVLHKVLELSRRVSFDVIVAYPELSLASSVLSKLLCVPLLVDFRTPMALQEAELSGKRSMVRKGAIIIRILEAIAVRGSMCFLAITPEVKDYLVHRYRLPPKRIFIAPSGVNPSLFSHVRQFTLSRSDLGISHNALVLGYVGSIHAARKLDFLVNAIKRLLNQNVDARLLLIGAGPDVPRLKKKIKQLNLNDRIIFTGLIPYEEVPKYLECVDICVSHLPNISSYRMSFPLKVLEYMAMGNPVLASRMCAHQRIIREGYNGLLYDDNDLEEFIAKTVIVAKDDNLRMKLVERGIRTALDYSWDRLSKKYESCIYKAVTIGRCKR